MTINQEISILITEAAKALHQNEKLVLPVLAAKARKAAEALPNDASIVNASSIIARLADNQTFISRAEFSKLLNSFHTPSTKLGKVFEEELGAQKTSNVKTYQRSSNEGKSWDEEYSKLANPLLANALAGAFAEKPEERMYTSADSKKAQKACYASLLALGLEPRKVEIFAGRNGTLLCQASYETPKGVSHVLVPVEIQNDKVIPPSMFLTNAGFEDLTDQNVIDHINKTAGKSFRVNSERLLEIIQQVKTGSENATSEVELAVIKMASSKSAQILDPSQCLYGEIIEPSAELTNPEGKNPDEYKFAEKLAQPDGIARFMYGDKVVEAGRSVILRKLAEFGYKTTQVRVLESDENKIFYSVAIGNSTGLRIPLDVVGSSVMPPKVVIADGGVTAFSKGAIDAIVKAGVGDRRALAAASPCYDMKPSELVKVVKESVAEGNYLRAEEAMNVLGEIDPSAQKIAMAHFMMMLSGSKDTEGYANMEKVASTKIKDTPYMMNYKIFFPEGV